MTRKSRTVTLTWTAVNVANDVAADTDTVIYLGGAERASVQLNTVGATTGAPNFDLHGLGTNGNTWTALHYQTGIYGAVAKNVVSAPVVLTLGPRYIKLRLDVNGANLVEFVTAIVFIDAEDAGRLVDA